MATIIHRVKSILDNEDKLKRFKNLLNFPLPSSRLIDKAADEYAKAFSAEDRYIDYEFSSDNVKADAAEYFDQIGFDDFLTKNLFNQCLRAAAAIWVVDLPAQANVTGFAEPTVTIREVGKLVDLFTDKRGNVESVVFEISPIKSESGALIAMRWAVLDDVSYRICALYEGAERPVVLLTNYHGLGRCPAGWIWHDRLDENNPFRIQSPLHHIFSDLDDLVISNVFRQHADLYASFPILWAYKSKCSYETKEGEQCRAGKVTVTVEDENGIPRKVERDCPVCAKNKPVGPGTQVNPPTPASKDQADLREPVGFINADRDLLDYNVEKIEALKRDILEALTGDSNNVDQTKDAVNEDQVQARFEARKGILAYWAAQLQQTDYEIRWVMLALRYGPAFLDLAVDYGSEFHLLSPAQAIQDYADARLANLPMYQMGIRRSRIDKLLAGANEGQMTRLELLAMLEPYPDLPLAMVAAGSDVWELKANFSQYIARFEGDNIGIERFGKTLSIGQRISNITQILYQYVNESKSRRQLPEQDGGGNKPAES